MSNKLYKRRMSDGDDEKDNVFFHFPPVPAANPGEKARITLGSPKSLPVSAVELGKLPPEVRLDTVLDCNCPFRLFGYKDKSLPFFA
jgi:hypothetical protein